MTKKKPLLEVFTPVFTPRHAQSEMRTCLFPLGWETRHFHPLLVYIRDAAVKLLFTSRSSLCLHPGSGGRTKGQGVVQDLQ